jgi:hypothetical protein
MNWSVAWHGFAELTAQFDLVLALGGLGLALGRRDKGMLAAGILLLIGCDVAAALGAYQQFGQFPWIEMRLADGTFLGALASIFSGVALLAPAIVASVAALLAAIANGVIAGVVISYRTPAGPEQLAFATGAISASILLFAMALTGCRLIGHTTWMKIAGRIAGAWLVAIAALLLALPASPKHLPPRQPVVSSLPSPPKAFRSVVPP